MSQMFFINLYKILSTSSKLSVFLSKCKFNQFNFILSLNYIMDNTNNPQKSSHKYEDLIKLRKAKLEKMRKERELLQYEKLKRASELTQEKFEEIRLKNEISEKAKQINDL